MARSLQGIQHLKRPWREILARDAVLFPQYAIGLAGSYA